MSEQEPLERTIKKLQFARIKISCGVDYQSDPTIDPVFRLRQYCYVVESGSIFAQCLLKLEKPLRVDFPDMFSCEDNIFKDAEKLLSRYFKGGIEGENELFERSKNLEEKFAVIAEKMTGEPQ